LKTQSLYLILAAWLALALLAGASGIQAALPMPFPQALIFTLTFVLGLIYCGSPGFRAGVTAVSASTLVRFHITRFVGLYFLYLGSIGDLPRAFATPAGIGDIVTATSAVVVASLNRKRSLQNNRIYFIWNMLGTFDILFVVANAARLGLADPASMQALTRLPLSLLPFFLVPLIIFSHAVLFHRLWRSFRTSAMM